MLFVVLIGLTFLTFHHYITYVDVCSTPILVLSFCFNFIIALFCFSIRLFEGISLVGLSNYLKA